MAKQFMELLVEKLVGWEPLEPATCRICKKEYLNQNEIECIHFLGKCSKCDHLDLENYQEPENDMD